MIPPCIARLDVAHSESLPTDQKPNEGVGPRRILVDWANQQDGWVRRLAAEVLATGRAIPEPKLAEFYDTFKAEKGLSEEPAADVPAIAVTEAGSEEEEPLILTKLHGVKGVNALVEGHEIDFNSRMTVLFGENGAGKTGYARVLKCAAGVRTAEDILPNARVRTQATSPSALIGYRLGEVENEIPWHNERGLAPFTRMSVFDAPAVLLHVDSELGYVYTPADLALFKHCSDAVRAVGELAAAEVRSKQSSDNPFLARFARGTPIYPLIESLGPATSLDELRTAAGPANGNSEKRREKLVGEIAALKGNTLDEKLFAAQTRRRSLADLISLVRSTAAFNGAAYETARDALDTATKEYRRVRTGLFTASELQGEADDEWQTFISAADEYRAHLGLDEYPHDGDKCLYCRQELDAASQNVIRRYRTFLDDSLGKQVGEGRRRLEGTLPQYKEVDLAEPRAFIARLTEADPKPAWLPEATWVIDEAGRLFSLCSKLEPFDKTELPERAKNLASTLEAAGGAEEATIAEIEKQKADRTFALETRQKEFGELEAQAELHKQLPSHPGTDRGRQGRAAARYRSEANLKHHSPLAHRSIQDRQRGTRKSKLREALRGRVSAASRADGTARVPGPQRSSRAKEGCGPSSPLRYSLGGRDQMSRDCRLPRRVSPPGCMRPDDFRRSSN